MRRLLAIVGLSLLFLGIVAQFWRSEWVYSLPTPVPDHYSPVHTGSAIALDNEFKMDGRPLVLHFFNPDCPCSRFNISHFKSLVKEYGGKVHFGIVVLTNKNYTAGEIRDKFGLTLPVSFDSAIAVACGVYSTPQAVIMDADHILYYRGNYNKSRYCTDKKSNYAQIALDELLQGHPGTIFDRYATTAYGCRLPKCSK